MYFNNEVNVKILKGLIFFKGFLFKFGIRVYFPGLICILTYNWRIGFIWSEYLWSCIFIEFQLEELSIFEPVLRYRT